MQASNFAEGIGQRDRPAELTRLGGANLEQGVAERFADQRCGIGTGVELRLIVDDLAGGTPTDWDAVRGRQLRAVAEHNEDEMRPVPGPANAINEPRVRYQRAWLPSVKRLDDEGTASGDVGHRAPIR